MHRAFGWNSLPVFQLSGRGRAEPERVEVRGQGAVAVPSCPGPGRALRGGFGAHPRLWALQDANTGSSRRPAPILGRSPSTGHGGTVGTGVALLGVLRGPLFVFSCTFFFLFLPSGPVRCPHLYRCLPQTLSSHGFIADPLGAHPGRAPAGPSPHCSGAPAPTPGKVPPGHEGTARGLWGKEGTRGHPDVSLKSGEGISDLETTSKRGSCSPDPPAFVSSASVISKSVLQRWKAGWEGGDGGTCIPESMALASAGQPLGPLLRLQRLEDLGMTSLTVSDAGVEEFPQKEPREKKCLSSECRLYTFYWKKKFLHQNILANCKKYT